MEYGEVPDVPAREVKAAPVSKEAPVKEEAPQKQPAPKKAEPARGTEELTGIWQDVCREAAKERPVLSSLSRYVPAGRKGDEIKLIVDISMMKDIVERNASYINGLLDRFGAGGHIVCVLEDEEGSGQLKTQDEIDEELRKTQMAASELLGIDVEIQK